MINGANAPRLSGLHADPSVRDCILLSIPVPTWQVPPPASGEDRPKVWLGVLSELDLVKPDSVGKEEGKGRRMGGLRASLSVAASMAATLVAWAFATFVVPSAVARFATPVTFLAQFLPASVLHGRSGEAARAPARQAVQICPPGAPAGQQGQARRRKRARRGGCEPVTRLGDIRFFNVTLRDGHLMCRPKHEPEFSFVGSLLQEIERVKPRVRLGADDIQEGGLQARPPPAEVGPPRLPNRGSTLGRLTGGWDGETGGHDVSSEEEGVVGGPMRYRRVWTAWRPFPSS